MSSAPGSTVKLAAAVAVSGDTIATAQGLNTAVDLVNRPNGAWVIEQQINAPTTGVFGETLAFDGDTLLLGTPENGGNNPFGVSIYVYVFDGTAWT